MRSKEVQWSSSFVLGVMYLALLVAIIMPCCRPCRAENRPVTVDDCVSMGELLDEMEVSRDSKTVAYIVKYANIRTDRNEYQIRVRALPGTHGIDNGRMIASFNEEVSGLHWLADNRHLTVIVGVARTVRRQSMIVTLDSATGSRELIATEANGITDYSINADGTAVGYLVAVRPTAANNPLLNEELLKRGFEVAPGFADAVAFKRGLVIQHVRLRIATRQGQGGHWIKRDVDAPRDAVDDTSKAHSLGLAYSLSMSPDGRFLAFAYQMHRLTSSWRANRTAATYLTDSGIMPHRVGVYDLRLHKFIDIPQVPFPHLLWWSDDSQAFATSSAAPIGTKWERQDAEARTAPREPSSFHIFAVNVRTGDVSEVIPAGRTGTADAQIISWNRATGPMLIEDQQGSNMRVLLQNGDEWREENSSHNAPNFSLNPVWNLGDSKFVGGHQDVTHPLDLWYIDGDADHAPVQLTRLNPEADRFTMGSLSRIQWKSKFGSMISGELLLPQASMARSPYPLVIMLTWPTDDFVCDAHYHTAFAPQPLVSSGFAVAIFNVYDAFGAGADQPFGPAQTKEAEAAQASVESLIDLLSGQGLIQRDNVGLVGFSRSSWKVDYIITHSRYHFAAASSADSGIGDYGASWLDDRGSLGKQIETGYGGPFAGSGKQAWLEGAPAFNADKVNTPLLMEYTGLSGIFEEPLYAYEFQSALLSLGKPVELYFYPFGDHPLDTPFERTASLQRNVDWFRFWMQGFTSTSPSYDPKQFARWNLLKQHLPSTSGRQFPAGH
jgi:dipeptidyl aminopeptidase/acylaminoacyl peptidase